MSEDGRPASHDSAGPGSQRGQLLLTTIVACVVLVFAAGLPLVDTFLTPAQRVKAGTQVALIAVGDRPAVDDRRTARVRFVPAAGWQLESQDARADRTVLTSDGVSFELRVRSVQDEPGCERALDRAESGLQEADGSGRLHRAQTFTTDDGEVGVTAPFLGARVEALVFAVCSGAVTVTMVASGPVGALQGVAADADPVVGMARSVQIA